jgi:hypothetical protein
MPGKLKPQPETSNESHFTLEENVAFSEVLGLYIRNQEAQTIHSKAAFVNVITQRMNKMKNDGSITVLTEGRTGFTIADLEKYFEVQ